MQQLVGRIGWTSISVLVPLLGLRLIAFERWLLPVLTSAVLPHLLIACGVSLLLASATVRRWFLASACATVTVIGIWLFSPSWGPGAQTPADYPQFTVVSANLNIENPDPAAAFEALAEHEPTVILLQEVDEQSVSAFETAASIDEYPYRVGDPRPGFHGSAIYSRIPLDGSVIWVNGWPMTKATVEVDGTTLDIINVHVVAPLGSDRLPLWSGQLDSLATMANERTRPLLLAGDFNATDDHRGLRRLIDSGFADGHRQSGEGFGATWPTAGPVSLLRLDRVYVTDELRSLTLSRGPKTGSDHHSLTATIEVLAREDRPAGN